ncbi:MAG: DUF4956 domain-containing protein [Desulfobulbaceae bacterium]|nr:DUF4956 domain-containing protein [Desulfobulbaceae bacterium]
MNNINELNSFFQPVNLQVDILQTLVSFIICVVMSFVLRKFYINLSYSLSGKHHIGSILPILSSVVFIVIVVVKTSLALSLGLVGALSIVRFRTPVKEPEDLVYLFLAIALGLGYGAGHILLTTLLSSMTLVIIFFWLSNRKISTKGEYNLILNWPEQDVTFEAISVTVKEMVASMKLIRLEKGVSGNTAVLLVEPGKGISLDHMVSELKNHSSQLGITFFEAKSNW